MSNFNPESVRLLQKLSIHKSDVISCDFSKHLHLATGSGDKKVIVCHWKPSIGFVETSYSPLIGHKYSVTCVRFSPTANILATASVDGHTILWDVKDGKLIHTLVQASGLGVRIVSFSKDGSLLVTAGEGGTLCLWSILPHAVSLIRAISGHDDESIQGAAFSPDSQLLVTGDVTGSYRVWSIDLMKDNQEASLATVRDAHDLGINSIEFSPSHGMTTNQDGVTEYKYTMYSCGNDHSIVVWSVYFIIGAKTSGERICMTKLSGRFNGHSSAISQIRVSPSGDFLASTSIDKTTRLWEVSKSKCVKILEGHQRYVTSSAFSQDESLLVTGSNDKMICIWDLSGTLNLSSILGTPDDGFYSLSDDIVNEKQQVEKGEGIQLVEKLITHASAVNTCHFGRTLFVSGGSDRKICVWRWSGSEFNLLRVIDDAHRYPIHQVELTPNERSLISASLDGTAVIWDSESGDIERSGFHVSGSGVRCARISPDSKLLAVGGDDDTLSLYSASQYELIGSANCDDSAVTSVAFSPNSTLMVSGTSDGHVYCFYTKPFSSTAMYLLENAHDLGVSSLDFAATAHMANIGDMGEGKYEMVSGGMDCLVKVWNVKSSERIISPVWTLSGHGGSITCVRYSPKLAELIASTATDKTCRIWDSYSGDCLYLVESHEGILTCCAFSPDATLLATGSMDKSLLIWALPKDLAFQLFVSSRIKPIQQNEELIADWLERNGIAASDLSSSELINTPIDLLMDKLGVDDDEKRGELENLIKSLRDEPPHEFICPITHHIMRDPVIAPDGQRYERSAIESWFGSGEKRSPMTNEEFEDTTLEPDTELRSRIAEYLRE